MIVRDEVQAVVYTPEPPPDWLHSVAGVIERQTGSHRALLPDGNRESVRNWVRSWLDETLGPDLTDELGDLLASDVGRLVDRLGTLADVSRFQARILIEAPTTRCGFHVDTVSPGAPSWGLLRVYNGAGTHYIDPADIVGTREFYRYLGRRERLERASDASRQAGDHRAVTAAEAEVAALDESLAFLRPGAAVRTVPAGAVVAFRHVDIAEHWSARDTTPAWIHCSPMTGSPRLVVNITSPQWARPIGRRAAAAHAR